MTSQSLIISAKLCVERHGLMYVYISTSMVTRPVHRYTNMIPQPGGCLYVHNLLGKNNSNNTNKETIVKYVIVSLDNMHIRIYICIAQASRIYGSKPKESKDIIQRAE